MIACDAVVLHWEGVIARLRRRGAIEAAVRAGLAAANADGAIDAVRDACAGGETANAAFRRVLGPALAPDAAAAFERALAAEWDVPGSARALLHSLRYRGYRIGVATELAASVDGLAGWMAAAGLPGYAHSVAIAGITGLPAWDAARTLVVLSAGSTWGAVWAAGGFPVANFPAPGFEELVGLYARLGEGVVA